MPKSLHILICTLLLFTIPLSSPKNSVPLTKKASRTSSPFLLNTYAVQSGPVDLNQLTSGFYVDVDLTDDDQGSDESTSSSDGDSANMLIALYTSNSLFSEGCLAFFEYDCTQYPSCTEQNNSQSSLAFPYFYASGYYVTNEAYIDYEYWNLTTRATVATSCTTNTTATYGVETAGILGMGATGNSSDNYMVSPVFGIFIDKSGQFGTLEFSNELKYVESNTPVVNLSSNSDWHISGVSSVQLSSTFSFPQSNLSIIFDINANAIGLPLQLYNQVINALAKIASANCPNATYYAPTCTYADEIQNLPDIQINVQTQIMSIPPEVYVKGGEFNDDRSATGLITLNLRALDPSLTGNSYVTPSYSNFIILDSNVMMYYYTLFQSNSSGTGTIAMYIASVTTSHVALFVCIGCAVAVVGLLLACWYIKKREREKKLEAHKKLEEEQVAEENKPVNSEFISQEAEKYTNRPFPELRVSTTGLNNGSNPFAQLHRSQQAEEIRLSKANAEVLDSDQAYQPPKVESGSYQYPL